MTSVQITAKERRAAFDAALALAKQGDDTALRNLTSVRYAVECTGKALVLRGLPFQNRARRFANPLFMTPAGYLPAFPELDEHLFVDIACAQAAIVKFGKSEHASHWIVRSTTLPQQLKDKRYQRWVAEVKPFGDAYNEPRRTLEENAAVYALHGLQGLKERYSRAHAHKLEHRILEAGLAKPELRPAAQPFGFRKPYSD